MSATPETTGPNCPEIRAEIARGLAEGWLPLETAVRMYAILDRPSREAQQ